MLKTYRAAGLRDKITGDCTERSISNTSSNTSSSNSSGSNRSLSPSDKLSREQKNKKRAVSDTDGTASGGVTAGGITPRETATAGNNEKKSRSRRAAEVALLGTRRVERARETGGEGDELFEGVRLDIMPREGLVRREETRQGGGVEGRRGEVILTVWFDTVFGQNFGF